MKKYLFFCFGEFQQSSVDNILTQVSRYSDKDKMLYQNGNGHLIVHMFSNDSLISLRNKLFESLSNVTNCQFLFEDDQYYDNMLGKLKDLFGVDNKEQSLTDYFMNDAINEMFQEKYSEGLSNIDKITEEISMNRKLRFEKMGLNEDGTKKDEVKEDYDFIKKLDNVIKDFIDNNKLEDADVSFECYEEDDDEDALITTTVKKEYFVDEILDKISEKGVSSLTQDELNFLNSFSK
jgi:hypothetical protein